MHTLGVVVRQIVLNPLIMSACAGALAAALHIHPPVAIDNTLLFLQNAAAPTALFVLGVTVALRPFGRVPWEVPGVIAVKLLIHPLVVFGLMLLLGTVRAAMGGHRGADGVAAAGAERVRDRPAKRHLDRARLRRGADRNLCLRRHAHQRDVAAADRAAGVSAEELANPPRRPPRRRQALAHGETAKRSDRADQMQTGRAQRLHRQEIAEQRAVRDIDGEGPAGDIGAPD